MQSTGPRFVVMVDATSGNFHFLACLKISLDYGRIWRVLHTVCYVVLCCVLCYVLCFKLCSVFYVISCHVILCHVMLYLGDLVYS